MIVLVGALLVVAATVYAAQGPATRAYRLGYETQRVALHFDVPNPVAPGAQPYRWQGSYTLQGANLSVYHVAMQVAPQGGVSPGFQARLALRAPNGTTYETQATSAAGDAGVRLVLDALGTPAPANRTVDAPGPEAARAQLATPPGSTGEGEWVVELDVDAAIALQTPFTVTHEEWADGWIGYADPVVAAAK